MNFRDMVMPAWSAASKYFGADWLGFDVAETDKEILVSVDLPGFEKEELHVSASAETLSIRGGAGAYKSLTLPATVRPEDVKASYKDGRLTVTLPKAKHSLVRRVPIA